MLTRIESGQAKCHCPTLMVQIFPSLKIAMGNNSLQTAIASSLSANFSLKLGLDSNPRTMQVGSTGSHGEAGSRRIVTSIRE